ncbi:VOC family protein [Saccharothrix algeriensis]|uniref:Catechol 2,3-dioxygenase-like lactoylglutathione lyase family enzyme n=1 Tax=Saccharothrix algeriensis TaxID=173560 RepID=A0A8T8HWE1_9PSEU|nr:VOC family protein [Saccharothrix algeriensis]MBM7814531.1 catechol 2,3-dioxygenase-like lactoylglutathione lyase family enzyme [Saccharothrix algeriensis]QTR02828.1 VOC family protein [Saccharothrix algeriensis]
MFGNLTVTLIDCKDVAVMTEFYRDRLGLKVLDQGENHTVFDTGNGGELVVESHGYKAPLSMAFTAVDIPAAHEALADVATTDLMPHKTGERFEIVDPEGNRIIFVNA